MLFYTNLHSLFSISCNDLSRCADSEDQFVFVYVPYSSLPKYFPTWLLRDYLFNKEHNFIVLKVWLISNFYDNNDNDDDDIRGRKKVDNRLLKGEKKH